MHVKHVNLILLTRAAFISFLPHFLVISWDLLRQSKGEIFQVQAIFSMFSWNQNFISSLYINNCTCIYFQLPLFFHRYSSSDPENVRLSIEQDWNDSRNRFHFQNRTESSPFLFVHQTADQARLMERYGNELSLLDATYRTTKYTLYLFFITVKTNMDYQVFLFVCRKDYSLSRIPIVFLL